MSCAWLAAPIATTTISVAGPGDGGDMACIAGQPDHEPEPEPERFDPTVFQTSRQPAARPPGNYPDGLTPAGDDEFVLDQLLSQDRQLWAHPRM
jgi:hypothetical protein